MNGSSRACGVISVGVVGVPETRIKVQGQKNISKEIMAKIFPKFGGRH